MKLSQLKINFTTQLQGVYDREEIHSFFYILCDFFLQYSRFEVSMALDTVVSAKNITAFEMALLRLKKQQPIQYIVGHTEFYGLTFKVNKHTLIPRPETEQLVDWIISNHKHQGSGLEILDIGTGSGCIAVALAKNFSKASISGLDISEKALEVAQENAIKNQVLVSFCQKDILETTALEKKYDVVVSNPPYVRQLEKKAMSANVLDNEPGGALFVPNEDPLLFYRKIAQLALVSLQEKGWLYFEINEYLSNEMDALLNEIGFVNIEIKKDFRAVPRMIKCQKL
ncbi:MAG TPA: peptide chain release factor N(5)-glutamine methyltransferase [Flavobacteriaceae bacterium]|nr:MAG: Release factor glutamine methyltransferase [Flavobacteriaceae bacterium]HAH34544.1 peptide chain release factor N(5)-glutamine methyltransferase [Flavobacteriaceae bacterium]